jgi:hypothetical protein
MTIKKTRLPVAAAVLHGPFQADAEVEEDQRCVLLAPKCEVIEAGM